jgi:dephospho-CoA kinase
MGKSTTAAIFADLGCAVWDADAAVHRLYDNGGAAVSPMQRAFPKSVVDNAISRSRLKEIIGQDSNALSQIEKIVHPLVAKDRQDFIETADSTIVVLDIPLLFENGYDKTMDAVACVYAPYDIQRKRVLARGTMTAEQFEAILAKQMPNEEKCARADFVIETRTLEDARQQVQNIVKTIEGKLSDA